MLLVFVRGKEEQFVFHDRSTERKAVSLCCLIGELHLLVQELVVAAIQVLVGVISKGGSSEFVGTRLCNGIDCTTRESTLANVERRHGDLDLVDGVERDGVGARLATVGAAGSERIDVVITEPEFSVKECEEIAEKLSEFFKPYFEKYKIRKI